jgi:hypothetical protein
MINPPLGGILTIGQGLTVQTKAEGEKTYEIFKGSSLEL